jgi:uncharacterized protein (TIGR00369 family)
MIPLMTDALLRLGQAMTAAPHPKALGLEVVRVEKARAELALPYSAALVGDSETGVIAAGAITALLDHVCGVAVMATLPAPAPIATLDLRIDYMRPATPARTVRASAHCFRLTRTIAFVRARAFEDSADDPIATATGAFILSGAPPQPAVGAPA